jgi:membrane protease YdiL (CAAX protease family)
MALLNDRSRTESAVTVAGTWLAFVGAAARALPQPPNPASLVKAALIGAVLVISGFAVASRCRTVPAHSARRRIGLASLAASAGAALGVVLLAALAGFAQYEPALRARFASRLGDPAWRPWALAFESSILEEVAFRLFVMSVIAWLAGRLLRAHRAAWVVALVVSALLFGAVHLPAWLAAAHATIGLVGGVLLLNGVGGLLLGWIFWRWGLPYAILCHFVGDVVVQGLGPRLLS